MAEGLLVDHESDLSVASELTQARVTEALKVGAETYEGELEISLFIETLPNGISPRLRLRSVATHTSARLLPDHARRA